MIKLRNLIESARRKPVLGLLVLVLLVALLVLVALHPAIDASELAAACLAIVAIVATIALIREPSTRNAADAFLATVRARPPTARPFPRTVGLLVPLRL